MKTLNLRVVIALVVAVFILCEAGSPENSTIHGYSGSSEAGSKNCTEKCEQSGTFGWESQFVDPKTGAKKTVLVVYKLDKGIMRPQVKIECPQNSTCSDDDGSGKYKNECPPTGKFMYDSYYADPKTKENITVSVGFELCKGGTVNPKINVTCYEGPLKCNCPHSGTFIKDAYRIDSKTKARTPVTATSIFYDGVYDFKVNITC